MRVGVLGGAGTALAVARALGGDAHVCAADSGGGFDVVVIGALPEEAPPGLCAGAAVICADERRAYRPLFKRGTRVVTYGFNRRACVTASAVEGGRLTVCVQREQSAVGGETLPRQEFTVPSGGFDERDALAAVACALVCGVAPGALGERLGDAAR